MKNNKITEKLESIEFWINLIISEIKWNTHFEIQLIIIILLYN